MRTANETTVLAGGGIGPDAGSQAGGIVPDLAINHKPEVK